MKREDRIKAAMKRIQELKILIKYWSKNAKN